MKVTLRIREWPSHYANSVVAWTKSLPFMVNPRAILVHRVRSAESHLRDGRWSHDVATYWCGNHGRGEFTDNPPEGRLLCAFCEARAVAAGEKTADELAGRHVHTGTLKANRSCCRNEEN